MSMRPAAATPGASDREPNVADCEILARTLGECLPAAGWAAADGTDLAAGDPEDVEVVTFPNLAARVVLATATMYSGSGSGEPFGRVRSASWREDGGCEVIALAFTARPRLGDGVATADTDALALMCRLRLAPDRRQ